MGTKNNPGKFDCYDKLKPDEPYFVLMGRDPSAADTVRFWVEHRKTRVAPDTAVGEQAKLKEALMCADAMAIYQARATGETYRALAMEVSDTPANARNLHDALNRKLAKLLCFVGTPNFYDELHYASRVLPDAWTLLNLTRRGPLWYAVATREGAGSLEAHGHGHTECAARIAMGLCAYAYDKDNGL